MCFFVVLLAFSDSTDAEAGAKDHREQDEHWDHRDKRDPYFL